MKSQSRRATNCATPGYLVFSEPPRVFPKQARYQLRYTRKWNMKEDRGNRIHPVSQGTAGSEKSAMDERFRTPKTVRTGAPLYSMQKGLK